MSTITDNGLIYIETDNGRLGVGTGSLDYGNAAVSGTDVSGEIVIPKYVQGKLVTSIQQYAFRECRKITSIKIEAPIVNINHAAFYRCISLSSITIPRTVEVVGPYMFNMDIRTSTFVVFFEEGSRLKTIGDRCFEYNTKELIIILPRNNLPAFGNNIFKGSSNVIVYMNKGGLDFSGITTKVFYHNVLKRKITNVCNMEKPNLIIIFIIIVKN